MPGTTEVADAGNAGTAPEVAVFSPAPLLTVTVECRPDGQDEIHLHAGGQGFWIARMATVLGADAVLSAPFGGETGVVLQHLVEQAGIRVVTTAAAGRSGCYVHDRRDGERRIVAQQDPPPLTRHEVDDLYGATLETAMSTAVTVLGGSPSGQTLPTDVFARLVTDLSTLGRPVVIDLSGDQLTAAVSGGPAVVKVSHEELLDHGRADSDDPAALVRAMRTLVQEGAQRVVVSRAADPALALADDEILEVSGPRLSSVDHRGAGDSMTAGIAVALARGADWPDALRLGTASGVANVTRSGLATGQRDLIEELTGQVRIEPFHGGRP